MLKLYGFAASNYFNMVKLVLLEKGIAYEIVPFHGCQNPAILAVSPRGKVPALEVEGALESGLTLARTSLDTQARDFGNQLRAASAAVAETPEALAALPPTASTSGEAGLPWCFNRNNNPSNALALTASTSIKASFPPTRYCCSPLS